MATAIETRIKRIEDAQGSQDAGFLFVWPNPPVIDADGKVVPARCHGAFYIGGAKAGQDVTDVRELEDIYGVRLRQ